MSSSTSCSPVHGVHRKRRRAAFMLLEVVIAVAIFALGVLALGRCLNNCLGTQAILNQEQRASIALENSMVELQANPSLPDEQSSKKLAGMFQGITLLERRRTLNLKNEKGEDMPNLHEITLTARWQASNGSTQNRAVIFDLLRGSD